MRVSELLERLKENAALNAQVAVINSEYPVPHQITDIKLERNEDGDGSETLWIIVEEM